MCTLPPTEDWADAKRRQEVEERFQRRHGHRRRTGEVRPGIVVFWVLMVIAILTWILGTFY